MTDRSSPEVDTSGAPSRLAHFRILGRLGQGGMGVVYRAEDETLRRIVAIKVLPEGVGGPETRQRFLREARSGAALSHPNVAAVFQVGEADGQVFIAMEFVEGESLRQLLGHGALAPLQALDLGLQIADGLAGAHEKGIVHRDLKPENVMITRSGRVKLLDFGLAKPLGPEGPMNPEAGSARTDQAVTAEPGRILGTPAYMSPEQAVGNPVDARSDVFSLGIVLYELVSGHRPFSGTSVMSLLVAIARDVAPPLREVAPQVDAAFDSVVMKCLAKEPAARFRNAQEVATALRARLPAGDPPAALSPTIESTRAAKSGTRSVAALGLAVLGALGVALVLLLVSRDHDRRSTASQGAPAPAAPKPAPAPVLRTIDLPLPDSSSVEARAAYEEGVRAWYDGVNLAYASFDRALERDPRLVAADLREAEFFAEYNQVLGARPHYRKVLAGRARLSGRDQAIADALEPAVMRDPPDFAESATRLRQLAERTSGDQGIAELAANLTLRRDAAPAELGAAAALVARLTRDDPGFALGWRDLAGLDGLQDQPTLAVEAGQECLRRSARATLCLKALIDQESRQGHCAAVLDYGRRWSALSPDEGWGDRWQAYALGALGQEAEAMDEVALRAISRSPAASRPALGLEWQVRKDVVLGDFAAADEAARELGASTGLPWEGLRAIAAVVRVQVAQERGDPQAAAVLARDYLLHRQAFAAPLLGDDPAPFFLAAERAGHLLTDTEMGAQMELWRREWRQRQGGDLPPVAWFIGEARVAATPAEAEAALAVRPTGDPHLGAWAYPSTLGHLLLLVKRPAEAAPLLETAARSCERIENAIEAVHATLDLGIAREELGDREGACQAYRAVVAAWSKPKPRSVSAERATARLAALACATPTSGPPHR